MSSGQVLTGGIVEVVEVEGRRSRVLWDLSHGSCRCDAIGRQCNAVGRSCSCVYRHRDVVSCSRVIMAFSVV